MNILFLANHLNVGGITSYILSLSGGLKARGHNVYVASSGGELLPEFLEKEITFIPIPIKTKSEASPKVLLSLFKLLPRIKEKNIDIIHSNTRVTQVLGYMLGRLSQRPFISTCHGFFKKRFSRKIFPCWGRKVIAISEQVKRHLLDDFNLREEDIRIIHHGIDLDKFAVPGPQSRAKAKERLGLGSGPLVGIIARLSDVKGHIYLIEAMKKVISDIPDARLAISGEGKMKERLVSLSRRLGLEGKVFFLSQDCQTLKVLSATDVFVMPSLKEGLGLALMEAMACGLAAVGSNVGGIKSLIQNDYNGLLVEPKDVPGLSAAISALLNDPLKRKRLGDNARDFIAQKFSFSQMLSQTEGVYQECLNARY